MKPMVVQKYGGTSVASLERMHAIADHLHTRVDQQKTVVVVSAMGNTTDRLLASAQDLSMDASIEKDLLLCTGELTSTAYMTMVLKQHGIRATCHTPWSLPIRTTDHPGQAWIRSVGLDLIRESFINHDVIVVPGFQGIHESTVTTLGRGGTDLSAVALSVALEANACEIYTDVPGVMTADPKIVPNARLLLCMGMDAIIEFAYAGAKVLQPRCVTLAKRFDVALTVRSSFDFDQPGTRLVKGEPMERTVLSGVALRPEQTYVEISVQEPVQFSSWLESASKMNGQLRWVQQNQHHLTAGLTVTPQQFDPLMATIQSQNQWQISHQPVAEVSLIGTGLRMDVQFTNKILQVLAQHTVKVMDIRVSDNAISCLIDPSQGQQTVRLMHDAFGLEKEPN
jgi:aspartate kinase